MKLLRYCKALPVVLACATWVLPLEAQAAGPVAAPQAGAVTVHDISLGDGGRLSGQALDGEGQALPGQRVVVLQAGQVVSESVTDSEGNFAATGLRGGVYQVVTDSSISVCRCWAAGTAPPAAGERVLLVSGQGIERGQRPIIDILSHPVVLGVLIAAAIAIPIAVHNNKKDRPSGS